MELNLIMSDSPSFRGIEYFPIYEVKNKKRYKGRKFSIKYKTERELAYMKDLDEDKNDNIVLWSYRKIKIDYIDYYTGKKEYFYPSFYIMTKGKELENKIKVYLDSPYKEYILHMVGDEEISDGTLLDEADYLGLTTEEQEWYDYNLLKEDYNTMKFDAAKKYCKESGFEFLVNYPDGTNVTIKDKPRFN